jgi:hypothetical protein
MTENAFPATDFSEHADPAPAGWLLAALQPPHGSPAFQAKCVHGAEVARGILRLRYASQRLGFFSALTVPAYLRGLAAVARVPIEGALRWAGLGLDDSLGPAFARGWSRLARALGLGIREALWHLRLTFVEKAGLELPALAARPNTGSGLENLSAACEQFVNGAVAGWDGEMRGRLRDCEQIVRDDYAAADAAEPPLP